MDKIDVRDSDNSYVARVIESRSPAGRQDAVQGWHNLLKSFLSQMAPYLQKGQLVTFRELKKPERQFFEEHLHTIKVPASAHALYLPPSVRHQMLYRRTAGEPQPLPEHSPDNPPDRGIVLGCRETELDVVVNALLAKPPFAPAIDVYDDGRLLAGYVYNTIDECIANLSKVLKTHLQKDNSR